MPSPPGTTSPHPPISGDPPLQAGLSTWLTLTQIQRIPKWDYCVPRIFFAQKLLAEKVYSGLQNAKLRVNSDHILLGAQITLSFSFFFSPRKSQSRAYFQASLNSVSSSFSLVYISMGPSWKSSPKPESWFPFHGRLGEFEIFPVLSGPALANNKPENSSMWVN